MAHRNGKSGLIRPEPKRPTDVRKRGRPDQASALNLEPHLLSAAEHVFIRKGYTAATMDAIATRARASKRTVYSRFPSKMVLFEAVVTHHIERSYERTEKMLKDTRVKEAMDVRTRLLIIAKAFRLSATDPISQTLDRILKAEAWTFPQAVAQLYREGLTKAVELVSRTLKYAGVEEPSIAASAFYHLLVVAPMAANATPDQIDDRDLENIVDFILHGAGMRL